jgi:acetyl-CoA acetyltransferase
VTRKFEDGAVISGIGQSAVGRRLGRSGLSLTIDAVTAAITDAGLAAADIDGIASYPGDGLWPAGFAGPAPGAVAAALDLPVRYVAGSFDGPAQLGPVVNAVLAVGAGLARQVVVYRTVTEGSARASDRGQGDPAGFSGRGPAPFADWTARYLRGFGVSAEQLGQVALVARAHAARNPAAIYRQPLSMADYLAARIVCDPLRLYDCDVHCDGSTALVVSHPAYRHDTPRPAVAVEAFGITPAGSGPVDGLPDHRFGRRAAEQMWSRTTLRPDDVDVALLYDGFSSLVLFWLESLGFCGLGEAGAFVDGGARITLDGGDLPLNPHGGQLSGGRLHGLGFVHEACLQLRGGGGARQVPGVATAVVAIGAAPAVGCALLRRADG